MGSLLTFRPKALVTGEAGELAALWEQATDWTVYAYGEAGPRELGVVVQWPDLVEAVGDEDPEDRDALLTLGRAWRLVQGALWVRCQDFGPDPHAGYQRLRGLERYILSGMLPDDEAMVEQALVKATTHTMRAVGDPRQGMEAIPHRLALALATPVAFLLA